MRARRPYASHRHGVSRASASVSLAVMALVALAVGFASPQAEAQQQAPAMPASVTVTRSNGALAASWPAVAGATSYSVAYSSDGRASWQTAASSHPAAGNTVGGTVSIAIGGIDNARTYVVAVRARNAVGDSGRRDSQSAGPYTPRPPAAPAGLTATADDASVTLAWSDPSDASITRYEHQYRYAGVGWQAWTAVPDSSAATTSYTVTGLTNGIEHRFRLRAVNADGASAAAPRARPWYVEATPQLTDVRKPNVVVIFADDLGYNDVSFNGATDISTPNIDRLADTGVTFTRGYVAAPICTPSRVGLLTGRYPLRSGVQVNWIHRPQDPADPLYGMSPSEKTVADYLSDAGYRTGIVGKWQIGSAPGLRPTERGFDYFYGMLGGGHLYWGGNDPTSNHSYWYPLSEDVPYHYLLGSRDSYLTDFTEQKPYLTDALTDKAVDFISAASTTDDPWFLYLPYNAPHTPLEAPYDLKQKYLAVGHDNSRATYLAMVESIDQNVGRVIDAVSDAGVRDDTLIWFLSDNGGVAGWQDWADNGVLKHGKGTLYEGGIRVPFVASWPGRWPAGVTFDRPVISLDIAATAMALAGAAPDPDADLPLDGVDLDGYVRSTVTGDPHEALYWHWWNSWNNGADSAYAVVSGDLKLVDNSPHPHDPVGLYDVSKDPGETVNLLTGSSDVAAQARTDAQRLRGLWNAWNADNLVSLYHDAGTYDSLSPHERALRTREIRCQNLAAPLIQIGTDLRSASTQPPSAAATAAAKVYALAPGSPPTLSIGPFGGAVWDYVLPSDHRLNYIQLRWRANDGAGLNDWTGHSSQIFYSECMYAWRIPGLTLGTEYKAKVFISTTAADGTVKYLKSDTVVFAPSKPAFAVSPQGVASWSYELSPDLTFSYAEVRWRTRGDADADDWTSRYFSKVLWNDSVSSWQLPALAAGTQYEARLFVGARGTNGTQRYFKSDMVVFTTPT